MIIYPGYIKTDDIVKYCEKMARDYELTNPSYSDACSDIGNKCLDLSNSDVAEVKHGKWIDYDDDYGSLMCSICEEDAPKDIPWDFCPYCGADMRGKI